MTATKRPSRRPTILVILLILGVLYGAYAALRPLAPLVITPTALPTRPAKGVSLTWPGYGGAAAGALNYGVLTVNGAERPLPTASIAKIVTALAVLHKKPLAAHQQGPALTIGQADIDSFNKFVAEDGSVVPVNFGEQLTEYQALQALLLPSGNNIAETLVRWAFGSVNAYNTYANTYVHQLGMTHTTITDPSGLAATTASTPRDLTLLGEAALANPVVADIVSQPSAIIPVEGKAYNYNSLLGQDGVVGIKTGNSDQDRGAFLFAANKIVGTQTVTIVGAVMNAPNLNQALSDSLTLSDSTADAFHEATITRAGDIVGTYTVPWQGTVNVVANTTMTFASWDGSAITTLVRVPKLGVPAAKNSTVGMLAAKDTAATDTHSVKVVLQEAIAQPSLLWRLTHPF